MLLVTGWGDQFKTCNDDFDEILVLVHKNAYDHTHNTQETVLDILLRLAQDCDFTRE